MMDNADESPGYTISGENPAFKNKMNDIFSGIDSSASNMMSSDSAIESGGEDDLEDNEGEDEGLSSALVIPSQPITKPLKPDFLVNPSHYTKYSLRETELSNNKANSTIAFQFLQELTHRKEPISSGEATDVASSDKHVFKMPEHVVGIPKPKQKRDEPASSHVISCDKVELDHLEENISAAEFAREIAAKLDDSIAKSHPIDSNPTDGADIANRHQFKAVNKKTRRHLRNKSHED